MKLRVLGCYGAKMPGYATSAFLVGDSILLDAGAVTSRLSLKEQVKIRSILVSHTHMDHIKDILFLADNVNAQNSHSILVYSSQGVLRGIKKNLFNWLIWPDFTQIPNSRHPMLRFKTIPVGKKFRVEGRRVLAFKSNHTVESLGYLIEGDKGWLLYSGDTGPNPKMWKLVNAIGNVRAMIVDVSFPNEMEKLARISRHMTPKMLEEDMKNLQDRGVKIYISHMKPAYLQKLSRELRKLTDPPVTILSPGTKIEF
ncbi:MAG: 3',5'-cyclic-nucleotide phosphodiesterase [Proteobacteria bacterium]|nr:3',5'-cyclic-nucleotide phosphodiesterase [Pseudomonadota bacterium]